MRHTKLELLLVKTVSLPLTVAAFECWITMLTSRDIRTVQIGKTTLSWLHLLATRSGWSVLSGFPFVGKVGSGWSDGPDSSYTSGKTSSAGFQLSCRRFRTYVAFSFNGDLAKATNKSLNSWAPDSLPRWSFMNHMEFIKSVDIQLINYEFTFLNYSKMNNLSE